MQKEFVIGFWGDPPLTDEDYQLAADAHFNLVTGNLHADTPDKVERQVELCRRHGMGLIATCDDVPPEQFPDDEACWGYIVRDEPNATLFPALAEKVEATRRARPGRLPLINLLGNYQQLTPAALAAEHYHDYVERYIQAVDPEVLCMDYYPFFVPDADDRSGLCRALEPLRRYSLKYAIPFWNVFNTMPYGPHTDPTESQLRWQVYTSLAYGSKGLLYFCYYTPPPGVEFPKGGAIISRDGRRTRHWYHARRINEQLRNLGPTLMQLTSTGACRILHGEIDRFLKGSGLKSIVQQPVDPVEDYLVGTFTHADGRRALMLNNYRFAHTAWPTVEFDVPLEEVREVDKWSGEEIPLLDDSPGMDGLQVSLDSGDGRLFLLPARE